MPSLIAAGEPNFLVVGGWGVLWALLGLSLLREINATAATGDVTAASTGPQPRGAAKHDHCGLNLSSRHWTDVLVALFGQLRPCKAPRHVTTVAHPVRATPWPPVVSMLHCGRLHLPPSGSSATTANAELTMREGVPRHRWTNDAAEVSRRSEQQPTAPSRAPLTWHHGGVLPRPSILK
jgi:hypothetical protein